RVFASLVFPLRQIAKRLAQCSRIEIQLTRKRKVPASTVIRNLLHPRCCAAAEIRSQNHAGIKTLPIPKISTLRLTSYRSSRADIGDIRAEGRAGMAMAHLNGPAWDRPCVGDPGTSRSRRCCRPDLTATATAGSIAAAATGRA